MLFAANSHNWLRVSRRSLTFRALATIIVILFLVTPGLAQTKYTPGVIKPDSPEGKNIKAAADFIREMGDSEVADQIIDSLNGGTLYSGILPSGTGEEGNTTPVTGNITLDTPTTGTSVVGYPTQIFDPKTNFYQIINLASVLYHEEIHSHQPLFKAVFSFIEPGGRADEREAWSADIKEIDRWVVTLFKKYQTTHDAGDLKKLDDMIKLDKVTIESYIDNNCYGGSCPTYKSVLRSLTDLQKYETSDNKFIVDDSLEDFQNADHFIMVGPTTLSQGLTAPDNGTYVALGTSPWVGGYGSLYGVLALSDVTTIERSADTGMVTATLHDCCTGAGGGIRGGYNWPVSSNVMLGPVFDVYAPNDVVNHQFVAGGNIRSTVNFTFTAKARASYIASPSLVFYAQSGLGLANQQLSLNFGTTPTSSHGDWTSGFVLGGGVEWLLSDGRSGLFGLPTSLFVDYDHAWWANAHFNTPAASPLFNYAWNRESNVFKAGVTIHFAPPGRISAVP